MIEQNIRYALPYIYFMFFLLVMLGVELNLRRYKHRTDYLCMFVMLVFACFFGLKGFVGHDNIFFYNAFEDWPVLQNFHGFENTKDGTLYEPGYTFATILAKTVGMNFWQFQFLGSAIDAIILYYVFRRESPIFTLALIIYIAMGGMLLHLEQIRNQHGVVLFMLALKYVREKRPVPYLLICGFAILMHYTSVIYFVAYPFLAMEMSKRTKIIIVVLCLLVFFLQIHYIDGFMSLMYKFSGPSIQEKIERYFRGELLVSNYVFSVRHVIMLMSVYFFILVPEKWGLDKIDNTLQNVFLASVITVFGFCELNVLENRLSQLFIIGIAALYPRMLVNLPVKLYKQIIALVMIGYSFMRVASAMKPYYFEYHTSFQVTKDGQHKKWLEYGRFVKMTTDEAHKVRATQSVKARTLDQLKKDSK